MSKTVDAPAESSPALDISEGFSEFQAEERAKERSSGPDEGLEEDAPGSEPETGAATPAAKPKEPLTPEQLREQKRLSNERRHAERERDLNASRAENDRLRAENERLKAGKAAPAESATATAKTTHADDPEDPRPKQSDFTDFDDYVDARSTWNARQVLKADRASSEAAAAETQLHGKAVGFMGNILEYSQSHPGFIGTEDEPGAFETVRDALEEDLPAVSAAIVDHEKPSEVIDYLGNHPEVLEKILEHRENPARALMELGRVLAAKFDTPSAAPEPPAARRTPKPPSPVRGGGHAPSGEAALDAAAEANDFSAFQKTLRARERRERQ